MNCVRRTFPAILFLFSAVLVAAAHAQVSPYVVEVKIPAAAEHTPLAINVELTQNAQIQRVVLHYREFGATEYKDLEMLLSGRAAVASLPAQTMTPPYIEYYLTVQMADNTQSTFPLENAEMNPLKIQVKGTDPRDQEVRFLSPEPGETLAAEDLAVAVSLMFTSDAVDRSRTRLFLDGNDVTNEAVLSDDVLLYSPKNFNRPLTLGAHTISVRLFDTTGQSYYTKEADFSLSTATALEEEKAKLQVAGNAQLELRNEKIDTTSTAYRRLDVHANGSYKYLTFGSDIHLTNEEKSFRQPQDRFQVMCQAADVARIQIGDAYPVLPSLFMSGKRVRGITGAVTLGYFNLDVAYGQSDRALEGGTARDTTSADSTRVLNPGTYARNILAVRPSFGSGEHFQLGLTYLHSKDDIGSIVHGTFPRENLVAGTDLLLAFDHQRVKWVSQAAFSLENTDISTGSYTYEDFKQYEGVDDTTKDSEGRLDALHTADNLEKVAKIGRRFITVNPFLSPLDLHGMPSLACESELSLNYFDNFLRALLFRRGISYRSYGNDFVQTDIEGINISDRVRLLENKMMASASFETKRNNTQNDIATPTTTFNTLNTSITYYPSSVLPSFTVGYGFNTRKNPVTLRPDTLFTPADTILPSAGVDSVSVADEITDRFFIALNYDFQWMVRNALTASFSMANKKDRTFFKRDQDNLNVSLSVTSYFDFPLQTTIGVVISHNASYAAVQDAATKRFTESTQKQAFNYQTISLGGRYRLLNERLSLLATVAPSFGDFKRLLVQTDAEYQVIENHFIAGQLEYIKNSGRGNDLIASIVYRLMFQ